jgi:hypothetical protein
MVMVPKPKRAAMPEEIARRQRRRAILEYLAKRHARSLEILAAYDRGEIDRPVAQRNAVR